MEKMTEEQKKRHEEIEELLGSCFYKEPQARIGFEGFDDSINKYSKKLEANLKELDEKKRQMVDSNLTYCNEGKGSRGDILNKYIVFYESLEKIMKETSNDLEKFSKNAAYIRKLAHDCVYGLPQNSR
jgi:hypothetical protein